MGTRFEYVKQFKDLEVYHRQRLLAAEVFASSNRFPREEHYSLTDQLRRSSRSIGAQIAEAWAKRLYPKHFISKLTDADGELMETQHWLIEAGDCQYLTEQDSRRLLDLCEEIGRMLGSMIRKAESFASHRAFLGRNFRNGRRDFGAGRGGGDGEYPQRSFPCSTTKSGGKRSRSIAETCFENRSRYTLHEDVPPYLTTEPDV